MNINRNSEWHIGYLDLMIMQGDTTIGVNYFLFPQAKYILWG
jgi:hypothetical protein